MKAQQNKNSENNLEDEQNCRLYFVSELIIKIMDYLKMRNFCLSEDPVRVKRENGKRYFQ